MDLEDTFTLYPNLDQPEPAYLLLQCRAEPILEWYDWFTLQANPCCTQVRYGTVQL